jgi:hypothetical protein
VWTRLEPQSVTGDPTPGLRAALHDPLWLLGRQWQFGEFRGEDAGTPIGVRIAHEAQRITAWQPGDPSPGLPGRPLPADEPLDPAVEREITPPAGIGLRARAEAGSTLVAMLGDAGLDARSALVAACPLPLDASPPAGVPAAFWQVPPHYRAIARTSPDGEAAATQLESGTPAWLAGAGDAARAAAGAWLAWYRASVAPKPASASDAWLPERLEYRFSIRAGRGTSQRVFRAPLHEGGQIDWYTFDHAPNATLPLDREDQAPAEGRREQIVLATPLRYSGMPADRLWEFEDGSVNLGKLEAQAHDLARLCLVEFAMVYSADWFVVPVDVDVGCFSRIADLSYTTTFGDRIGVPHADDRTRMGRFRMFGATVAGTTDMLPGLLVPPSARSVVEGTPLEEVLLLRDEMANMAWAIEQRVPTVTGEARARGDEPRPVNTLQNVAAGAEMQYLLQTAVPAHWIPLVPVATGTPGTFVLRKGTMTDVDQSVGVLLDPTPFTLQEEEVPREGVRVRRVPSLARARDGRYLRWVARRVSTGRGEAMSMLGYDLALR